MKNLHKIQPECIPEMSPPGLSPGEMMNLFEDVLNSGLRLRIRATGESMTPFLKGGEILTLGKVRSPSLRKGDLIFFRDLRGFPLIHRIIRKRRMGDTFVFQTKGDALLVPDDKVSGHDVIGKVLEIEKTSPDGRTGLIYMESFMQKGINYFFAIKGLCKSRVCLALQKSGIYSSLRSIVKKTLV